LWEGCDNVYALPGSMRYGGLFIFKSGLIPGNLNSPADDERESLVLNILMISQPFF
jgi:hypothetical protein